MSDTRDRIAKAITALKVGDSNYFVGGDDALEIADAVLDELGWKDALKGVGSKGPYRCILDPDEWEGGGRYVFANDLGLGPLPASNIRLEGQDDE